MWNSVTLKRSLMQMGKTPLGNPSGGSTHKMIRSVSRRWESSSSAVAAWESSSNIAEASSNDTGAAANHNNGIIQFTMAPNPPPAMRGFGNLSMDGAISASTTQSSDIRHISSQSEYEYDHEAVDDHRSSSDFQAHVDPFLDRSAAAEQMTNLMENSYYYASFKAQGNSGPEE